MPLLTFTPGDLINGSSAPSAMSAGAMDSFAADITPAGWPTGGTVSSVEVELTATAVANGDGQSQLVIAHPDPLAQVVGALTPAAGVWSGAAGITGGYRTSTAGAFYLQKFGGWRTNYILFGTTGGSSEWLTSTSTATPGAHVDIRVRCRRATWNGAGSIVCANGPSAGAWDCLLSIQGGGVLVATTRAGVPGTWGQLQAPWSAFSETNGQWHCFRVLINTATGAVTWYEDATAVDLASATWTSVATNSFMPMYGWLPALAPTTIRLGSGALSGFGFGGDISHIEIRDGSGQLLHRLGLDAMDSVNDTAWTSGPSTLARISGGNFPSGATIPATIRARIDLDTPFDPATWRLILDRQSGAYTVDEIVLDHTGAAPPAPHFTLPAGSGGWSVGTTFLEHSRNGLFDKYSAI